jgi:beta-N-acetylhexosaminidase
VPYAIASGADVFLFTRNLEEDYAYMLEGVKSGLISPDRLEEALVRILALKAALHLNEDRSLPTLESAQAIIGCQEHREWAKECADKSVTLVKEQQGVLPISPDKYPRVLYCPIESEAGFVYSVKSGVCDDFKRRLEDEGFHVTAFIPSKNNENEVTPFHYYEDNFDIVIYCANLATKSNQTTVRIDWQQPMGANCPHFLSSIPTLFVSVENPYHLLDVPRIKTFINAYCSTPVVLDAIIEKLMGRSEFIGKNPVDPFCGQWDTHL